MESRDYERWGYTDHAIVEWEKKEEEERMWAEFYREPIIVNKVVELPPIKTKNNGRKTPRIIKRKKTNIIHRSTIF